MDITKLLNRQRSVKAVTLSDGEQIFVRKLTVNELDGIMKATTHGFARSIVVGCCDESGKSVFTEKDIPAISNIEWEYGKEIVTAIREFNNLGDDVAEKKS